MIRPTAHEQRKSKDGQFGSHLVVRGKSLYIRRAELYQESDTDIEELLEKCDTPPARKPKGHCVQSITYRSHRQGTDKLTRAATPPTPPSVNSHNKGSPNLTCTINYAVDTQTAYCGEDNVTFDHSQTQLIRASDSPKLSSMCGQYKQNGEVLKCERCLEIACAKC